MAKTVKFGTTVWGSYFLDALHAFYKYDARVGRGRTYASTGRVFDLKINKTNISAKVTGNYEPFYRVKIKFTPLKETQIKKIYKIIDSNPILLGSIINGELPDRFLEELRKNKINLFPSSYHELKTACNCPDWGDPCKHIAGVYYILTLMIDNNPFILFEIRGIDLLKHYNIKKEIDIAYPIQIKLWKNEKYENKEIDLIKLDNFTNFILSKLDKNPFFLPTILCSITTKWITLSKSN